MLARGETTSRAIVEACLARIATDDGKLHAFVDVYRDDARKLAEAADLERRARVVRGPLHGLPIALKDLFELEGPANHRGVAESGSAASPITLRPASTSLARRRHDSARQDAPGRVRVRRLGPQRSDGRAVESVGPGDASCGGRIVERLGGRGGGGTGAGGDRLRYRRLGAHSRRAVRHHRTQDDVRAGEPAWRGAAVDAARHRSARSRTPSRIVALLTRRWPAPIRTIPGRAARLRSISRPRHRRPSTSAACALQSSRPNSFRATSMPSRARARRCRSPFCARRAPISSRCARPSTSKTSRRASASCSRPKPTRCAASSARTATLRMDPWVRKRVLGGKAITAADYIVEMHAMRAAQAAFAAWMRDWDALLTPTLPITATPLDEVDEATAPLAAFTRAVNYLGGVRAFAARGILASRRCRSACSSSARRSRKHAGARSDARSSRRPTGTGGGPR